MDDVRVSEAISPALQKELQKLVVGARILEINGHGDRIFGHVALRDPEGRGFWMKRHEISLGEMFDHRDFVLVAFTGEKLAGAGRRHSEWPIHAELMLMRPDLNVTCHTHPFHSVIFSAVNKALGSISGPGKPPPRFEGTSEYIDTPELGRALAQAMGKDARATIMRHHGVLFAGPTIEEAILTGIDIEYRCKQMLTVGSAGELPFEWPSADELARKFGATANARRAGSPTALWNYYCRVLARAVAQGDPQLSQGSLL